MIQVNVDQFFSTALERLQIKLKKDVLKVPKPWTKDPVFPKWRFCNTYREDDRTTVWFRQNLRQPLRDDAAAVLLATVVFRWFNRIETGEILLDSAIGLRAGQFNSETAKVRIFFERPKGPHVTGAYIIKTPNGKSKLDGVIWCIQQVQKDIPHLAANLVHTPPEERKMEGVWSALREYPYLGPFMAYQIVSDLRHTCWLDQAEDANTWASLGPGSTRGCGWLFADKPDAFSLSNKNDWKVMLSMMRELVGLANQKFCWPRRWEMQTVQHWLCEYDKYRRAAGGQEMKRKYS